MKSKVSILIFAFALSGCIHSGLTPYSGAKKKQTYSLLEMENNVRTEAAKYKSEASQRGRELNKDLKYPVMTDRRYFPSIEEWEAMLALAEEDDIVVSFTGERQGVLASQHIITYCLIRRNKIIHSILVDLDLYRIAETVQ
ncbi:hypothetical protein MLD52_03965 [Puniceicoccaceae bacterium K14]|nr:hypothetical protein [Puniceicoccaceae bacterium K14]